MIELLDEQIELREARVLASFPVPSADPSWLFQVDGFDPFREREVETWLTVANGETGTRGSLEEGSPASTPATFVAGVFGDDTGELHIREPVAAPDWLCLRLLVEGMPLNLMNGEFLEHRRVLDMSQGIVFRYWRQRDRVGRTVRVRTARFASLADRAVMVLRAEASPEDFCGRLVWEACVGLSNAGGPVYRPSLTSLDGTGFVVRTKGRKGGGHTLAVSTKPAIGSPAMRYLEQSRDVIGGQLSPRRAGDHRPHSGRAARRPAAHRRREARWTPFEQAERAGFDERWPASRAWRATLARRRNGGRGRPRGPARDAVRELPPDGAADPDEESVLGRGAGLVGPRVSTTSSGTPRCSWCRSSPTRIPRPPGRCWRTATGSSTAPGGRPARWATGGTVPLGVGGQGGRHHAADGIGRAARGPHPLGGAGAARLGRHRLGHLGVLEGHRRRRFPRAMGAEMLLETARFWVSRATATAGRYHIPMVIGPDEYHEASTTTPTPTCWRAGTSSGHSMATPGSPGAPRQGGQARRAPGPDGRRAHAAGARSPADWSTASTRNRALRAVRRLL